MGTTDKEQKLLADIAASEYQDGGELVGHHVWLDYIVASRSRGGILSSLIKKGLVEVDVVPFAQSDNRQNGVSDSTVALTRAGADALTSPLQP